jgi:hypothetical protein
MSLTLDDRVRTQLDRVRGGVAGEFPDVSEAEVNARFEEIVAQLLSEASFGDFVPVLAWRYSRESLRATEGLPAEFRDDP